MHRGLTSFSRIRGCVAASERTCLLKVSVVIPCYNCRAFIDRCVQSVLNQSYPIHEVVVVDDGSTDGSMDVLKRLPVKVVRHRRNLGLAQARNTGVIHSSGDVVAFTDADCVAHRDWVKNLVRNYSDDKVGGVGGRGIEANIRGVADLWRKTFAEQTWGDKRFELTDQHLYGLCFSFRRRALFEVGLFNPFFRTNAEDIDISRRMLQRGYRLIYDPEAIVYHFRRDSLTSLLKQQYRWRYFGSLGIHLPYFRRPKTEESLRKEKRALRVLRLLREYYGKSPKLFSITLLVWSVYLLASVKVRLDRKKIVEDWQRYLELMEQLFAVK